MQEKLEKCFCLYLYEKTEGNKGFFFFNEGTIPNKKSQQVFLECHGSFEHGGKGVPRGQVGYVVSYLRVQNYIDFKTKMNIPNLNFL